MEMLYGNMAEIVIPKEETFNGMNDFNNINLESARVLERYEQSLHTNIAQIVEKDEDKFIFKAYVESLKKKNKKEFQKTMGLRLRLFDKNA